MRKKKVFIFIDWYLPGLNAGGPVRTCANLVSRLSDEFDFLIATRNTDLNASQPYSNVQSDEWNRLPDGSRVYYFSKSRLSYSNIRQLIADEKPDAIHLNSLFSWYFTILPLVAAKNIKPALKVVAGPRGMLSKGALAIKPFKKQLFIAIAKLTKLFSNVTWHASTPIEAEEIKQTFGQDVKIKLGIDLAPAKPIVRKSRIKKTGELSLFYLGRVSPVKNLLQCIDVLKNIHNSAKVNFDIYGPVEDIPYWKQCQEEIKKLPSAIQVSYKGLVAHEKLDETITQYHFLMLLTENENYGHAIVESLTCGCPVIISNRTPWRSLEKISAGWDLELEKPDEIIHALKVALSMDQETYDQWSAKAYDKGIEIAENAIAVEENKNLFR